MSEELLANEVQIAARILQRVGFETNVIEWSKRLDADQECRDIVEQVMRQQPSGVVDAYSATVIQLHGSVCWAEWGFNRFVLTDSLAAELCLTKVDREAELPYPSFSVEVPKGILGDRPHRLMVCPVITYKDGLTTTVKVNDGQAERIYWLSGVTRPLYESTPPSVRKLVFGLASFIESRTEALTLENASAVRASTHNKKPVSRVYVVGRTIKLSSEMLKAGRAAARGDFAEVRKFARHSVLGHFRWQACGPRHTERKKIWIRPHKRGEGDHSTRHTYIVGDP